MGSVAGHETLAQEAFASFADLRHSRLKIFDLEQTHNAIALLTHLFFPRKIVPAIEHTFTEKLTAKRAKNAKRFKDFLCDLSVLRGSTKDSTWNLD